MEKIREYLSDHTSLLMWGAIAALAIYFLLLYKLGTLTGGLSQGEHSAATIPLGWHGIYHDPFYLPLKFVRSIDFFIFKNHGALLTRLPNVLFGVLAIAAFALLVKLWHNWRTAIIAVCLFATSAWVLHVSRLASYDVLYLLAMPLLLAVQSELQRHPERPLIFYGSVLLWGIMLYIPGLVWLVLLEIFWLRQDIMDGWRHFSRLWQRLVYGLCFLVWLPLLIWHLTHMANLKTWLGLPMHFDSALMLLKHFVGVFVHLYIRGPEYPATWLGQAPVLDIFVLVTSLLGLYFYATHLKTSRSRFYACCFVVSAVLIGLGGPVQFSLIVPLAYLAAATGIAYLLYRWHRTFPVNPLARSLGLVLIVIAVGLSCLYNLRAYFVAWPHNQTTQATFRYRR